MFLLLLEQPKGASSPETTMYRFFCTPVYKVSRDLDTLLDDRLAPRDAALRGRLSLGATRAAAEGLLAAGFPGPLPWMVQALLRRRCF